ncbi:MAG: transporter substrate-binding domain-containing protein [Sneathiella sp.]
MTKTATPTWPPFITTTQNNRREGIAFDKARLLLTRLQIPFKIDPVKPWARVLEEGRKGDIDLIITLLICDNRKEYFRFTKPWLVDTFSLVKTNKTILSFHFLKTWTAY